MVREVIAGNGPLSADEHRVSMGTWPSPACPRSSTGCASSCGGSARVRGTGDVGQQAQGLVEPAGGGRRVLVMGRDVMVAGRHRPDTAGGWVQVVLRVAGAVLLAVSAGIHLDLYLTGYRSIPTIGWLFLLQVIAGFALAAAVLVTRGWLVAAAGAGFALATLGGYLLSVWIGLFGFKEVRTTAGIAAGLIEVAAFAT